MPGLERREGALMQEEFGESVVEQESFGSTALLIDDDQDFREVFSSVLEELGFTVLEADNGMTGLGLAKRTAPDVVLVDQRMPRMTGIEVAMQIRAAGIGSPIILVTAATSIPVCEGLTGSLVWVRKPFSVSTLQEILAMVGFVATASP
jgi:CheY-like chemotaxis protein